MGATLGQGWYFGRPGPLPAHSTGAEAGRRPIRRLRGVGTVHHTPFDVVTKVHPPRPASPALLRALSDHIEFKAMDPAEPAVLLACFQHASHFGAVAAQRYTQLAATATMVAVLAEDMPAQPLPRVRGTALNGNDPLADEWVVIVIGPHFAAALVALEHKERDPAGTRRFGYVITHDRALVIEAAQPLIHRIQPVASSSPPPW
jgi:DICT domain-containing protein